MKPLTSVLFYTRVNLYSLIKVIVFVIILELFVRRYVRK